MYKFIKILVLYIAKGYEAICLVLSHHGSIVLLFAKQLVKENIPSMLPKIMDAYVLLALSTCVTSSVIFVMNVAITICLKLQANFYQVVYVPPLAYGAIYDELEIPD
jgi:hypothetical protein